jgi:hypothetical protein
MDNLSTVQIQANEGTLAITEITEILNIPDILVITKITDILGILVSWSYQQPQTSLSLWADSVVNTVTLSTVQPLTDFLLLF